MNLYLISAVLLLSLSSSVEAMKFMLASKPVSGGKFSFYECSNNPFHLRVKTVEIINPNNAEVKASAVLEKGRVFFRRFRYCREKTINVGDKVKDGIYQFKFLNAKNESPATFKLAINSAELTDDAIAIMYKGKELSEPVGKLSDWFGAISREFEKHYKGDATIFKAILKDGKITEAEYLKLDKAQRKLAYDNFSYMLTDDLLQKIKNGTIDVSPDENAVDNDSENAAASTAEENAEGGAANSEAAEEMEQVAEDPAFTGEREADTDAMPAQPLVVGGNSAKDSDVVADPDALLDTADSRAAEAAAERYDYLQNLRASGSDDAHRMPRRKSF